MFKNLVYIIGLIGSLSYSMPIKYTSDALLPYVNEVMDITNKYCPNRYYNKPVQVIIKISKLKGTNIGLCTVNPGRYTIQIDADYWTIAKENEKFSTITHEMSHCLLNSNHNDDINNYMYYEENSLNKSVVIEQYIKDVINYCKD